MKLSVPTANVPSASQYNGARDVDWVVEVMMCSAYAATATSLWNG